MRCLALAIAALAAAPALAQQSSSGTDWSKPVEGVDDTAPHAPPVETTVVLLDVTPLSAAAKQSADEFARNLTAATPLPPCEPPVSRAPNAPAPPKPPAPCSPLK